MYSYNQIKIFNQCKKKYYHRYVAKTIEDTDYNPNRTSLEFGTLAHILAEKYSTNKVEPNFDDFLQVLQPHLDLIPPESSNEFIAKLWVVTQCIVDMYQTKLADCTLLQTEYQLNNRSIVDVILKKDSNIYLFDYKTVSSFEQKKLSSLHNDSQLNYYAYGLKDEYEISHIGHIELLKTSHKMTKKDASAKELAYRIVSEKSSIRDFYRIVVAKYDYTTWSRINRQIEEIEEIEETEQYFCNYDSCVDNYGGSCPYFSQCNKCLFSSQHNYVL